MRFVASDRGIGLPKEEEPYLFESFRRGSNVGARQGTGLGLVIIKRSAELHGGAIHVRSRPGQGSRFRKCGATSPPSCGWKTSVRSPPLTAAHRRSPPLTAAHRRSPPLTAAHGRTGVALALAERPDLILCDVMMPELDGYGA